MREIIEGIIKEEKGYNCAELIIRAFDEKFKLNISEQTLKSVKGFGGGMGVGSTCGIITGAITGITVMCDGEIYITNKELEELIKILYNQIKKELKDDSCTKLLETNKKDGKSCWQMIIDSGEVFEKFIFNNFEVKKINEQL